MRWIAVSFLCLGLMSGNALADEDVENINPSGPGSLPQAVANVNDGGNVNFTEDVVGGTISLGNLNINKSMSFVNNTGGSVTVNFADPASTPIVVDSSATFSLASGILLSLNSDSSGTWTALTGSGSGLSFDNIAGTISSTTTVGGVRGIACTTSGENIQIQGNLTGSLQSNGVGTSYGMYTSSGSLQIDGNLNGNISSQSSDSDAYGAWIGGDITINGNLSGTITSTTLDSAYALRLSGDLLIAGTMSGNVSSTGGNGSMAIAANGDLVIAGGISGNVAATSTGTTSMAYGVYSDGSISGGSGNPLLVTGTISASADAGARAIMASGGINLKVAKGASISAVSQSSTLYAIQNTGVYDSNIELVAGCEITGQIRCNGSADTLTLSGNAADSTTINSALETLETININSGQWTLNAYISGSQTINFNGGVLKLQGTGTSGVSLEVPVGGTLGGNATLVNLTNRGAVAPGNSIGALTVTGDYINAAGSTLEIEIDDAGNRDQVVATGNADIQGGTVSVLSAPGTYSDGATYTFLTAGSVSGTFDGITNDLAFFDASLVYYTDSIQILLNQNSTNYDAEAHTANQHAVARVLDANSSGATGDFKTVLNNIDTLSGAGARSAFDAMSGSLFGGLATVGIETNEQFLRGIADRLQSQAMARGFEQYAAENSLTMNLQYCSWLRDDCCACDRWSTWAEGYGAAANIASDGNSAGLNYSTGGLLVGIERRFNDDFKLGLVGGYSSTYATPSDNGNASIDGGQLAVFLHRNFGAMSYFTSIAAYGYNSYATNREIAFAAINRTAHANYGGNNFSFYNEIGRTLFRRYVHLQPYGALEYINVRQNDFTETGADSIDLASNGETAAAFRSLIGARVFSNIQTVSGRMMTFEGRVAWRHEFLDESRVLDAAFSGALGSSFAVAGVNVDRDVAILGLGTTYRFSSAFSLFANYDATASQNYTSHTGSGGLQYVW